MKKFLIYLTILLVIIGGTSMVMAKNDPNNWDKVFTKSDKVDIQK